MPIDPRTPTDAYDRIALELKNIADRLDTLEAPSGTSLYKAVAKLEVLVNDIQAELADFIANDVTAIVDARVAIAIASYMSGNVSIGGELFVNGPVTMPNVFNTNIVPLGGSRYAAWVRDGGRLGHT